MFSPLRLRRATTLPLRQIASIDWYSSLRDAACLMPVRARRLFLRYAAFAYITLMLADVAFDTDA